MVNIKSKKRIETLLFNIIKKNNFNNIFKTIPVFFEFCGCYQIIEEQRIIINEKNNNLDKNNKNYNNIYWIIKQNSILKDACSKRNIYLDIIINEWEFYKKEIKIYIL